MSRLSLAGGSVPATEPTAAAPAAAPAAAVPADVLKLIFALCESGVLLASARGVCRLWRELVNDPALRPWAKAFLGASSLRRVARGGRVRARAAGPFC